jgi:hypothetical protein
MKYVIEANKKDGYEVDVFIHTWTETEHTTIGHNNIYGQQRKKISLVTDKIINKIHEYYNPKKILVEKQIDTIDYIINEKATNTPRAFKGVINVSYTIYKSSELRRKYENENNIYYDFIIVTRPDIMFHEPFRLDIYLSEYKKFNGNIPQNEVFFAPVVRSGIIDDRHIFGGSDILYFGNKSAIDSATNLYKILPVIESEIKEFCKNFYNFEMLWYDHWINSGLKPISIKYCRAMKLTSFTIVRISDSHFKYWSHKIIKSLSHLLLRRSSY